MVLAFAINNYFEKYGWKGRFLIKISGLYRHIYKLLSAALSPRCKRIFIMEPKFIYLPKEEVNVSFPAEKSGWQEKKMSYWITSTMQTAWTKEAQVKGEKKICESLAEEHRDHQQITACVHGEVKVVINLFTHQTTIRPYPYIGLSKFSCFGCFQFLESFNKLHGLTYMTKGMDTKHRSPYGFPQNCPSFQEVLNQYYEEFNDVFVRWYTAKDPYSTAWWQSPGLVVT